VRKKIYPKRAIGLNSFAKNTGGNYFFTMDHIDEKQYFECSKIKKIKKKIFLKKLFTKNKKYTPKGLSVW
jgi:hypothetical protein